MSADPPLDDATLAEAVRRGGPDATAAEHALVRRLQPRIRVYLARRQVDPYALEDGVQEVLIALLEAIRAGRLEDPTRLGSYALGICRNKTRESTRRDLRTHRAMLRLGAETSVEMPLPRLQMGRLEECLHLLRERDRVLLRMVFVEGRNAGSVGAELRISPEAVRVRRHRAIDRLRRCLGVGKYEAER